MSRSKKVMKWARILHALTIAAMVLLPIAIIGGFLSTPLEPEAIQSTIGDITVSADTTRGHLFTAVALNLITSFILILTLNEMRKLFAAYTKGDVLTDKSAEIIQRIGQGFLALAIVPLVVRPIQTVLLTLANPPGERSIAIGIDSDMLFFALAGGLIIVIGWAMREASAVASENKSFV